MKLATAEFTFGAVLRGIARQYEASSIVTTWTPPGTWLRDSIKFCSRTGNRLGWYLLDP